MDNRSNIRSQWERITFFRSPNAKSTDVKQNIVSDDEPKMIFKGRKFSAIGVLRCFGFTVYAGSTVNPICESFKRETSYYPVRNQLESDGTIKDGRFTCDYLFKSAQFAASVIASRAASARHDWKTEDGRCYGEIYSQETKVRSSNKTKDDGIISKESFVDEFGVHITRITERNNGMIKKIEFRK